MFHSGDIVINPSLPGRSLLRSLKALAFVCCFSHFASRSSLRYHLRFSVGQAQLISQPFAVQSPVNSINFLDHDETFENIRDYLNRQQKPSQIGMIVNDSITVGITDVGHKPLPGRRLFLYSYGPSGYTSSQSNVHLLDPFNAAQRERFRDTSTFPDWRRLLSSGLVDSRLSILDPSTTIVQTDANGQATFKGFRFLGFNHEKQFLGVACEGVFLPLPISLPYSIQSSVIDVTILGPSAVQSAIMELELFDTPISVRLSPPLSNRPVFAMLVTKAGIDTPNYTPVDYRTFSMYESAAAGGNAPYRVATGQNPFSSIRVGSYRDKGLMGSISWTDSNGM